MIEIGGGKKKKMYMEIERLYGKNESSIRKVMKRTKKKFVLVFLLHHRLQKLLL